MKRTGAWLAAQWEKSNLLSGVLAIAVWGAIIYLAVIGRDLPDVLVGAGGIIMGFFFRSKSSA